MKCPECGRENTGNTGFCISCGAGLPYAGAGRNAGTGGGPEREPDGQGPEQAIEEDTGGSSGAAEPPGAKRRSTGLKIAVVLLAIAAAALAGTTAYFATAYTGKKTRVEELSTKNVELSQEVNALPYVLEGLETISRQTVNVIEKYYPGDRKKKGEWQDYVTDSLETIEKLSGIYREYLEGGQLDNTSFLETVEKIVNEFLKSDDEKVPEN